jgi:hypothetical protein
MWWAWGLASVALAADQVVCADTATCSRSAECLGAPAACHASVQPALDAAGPGDTVFLSDETYVGDLVRSGGGPLTVVGAGQGSTVIVGAAAGHVLDLVDLESTWTDLTVTTVKGATSQRGAKVSGGDLTLRRVEVHGGVRSHGGALDVENGAQVLLDEVWLHDNVAFTEGGGHIYVHDGEVTVIDSLLQRGSATAGRGGAIRTGGGSLVLHDTLLEEHDAQQSGGSVYAEGATVSVLRTTMRFGRASGSDSQKGGAIDLSGGSLFVDLGHFEGNSSLNHGGSIHCSGVDQCEVRRSVFLDNEGRYGPAVALQSTDGSLLAHNLFCSNGPPGASEAGAVLISGGSATLRNNVFWANSNPGQGGALYATDGAVVTSTNNGWVANGDGSGAALWTNADTVASVNDLYLANAGNDAVARRTNGILSIDYASFFGNSPIDTDGTVGVGVRYDDPLVSVPASCDASTLMPPVGSPLVDAGDPGLFDPDGSVSDIGPFGGPEASPCLGQLDDTDRDGQVDGCDPCPDLAFEVDGDGDGWWACDDCDDTDPSVFPGAYDAPGDGVDQDCDGGEGVLPTGDTGADSGADTGGHTGTIVTGDTADPTGTTGTTGTPSTPGTGPTVDTVPGTTLGPSAVQAARAGPGCGCGHRSVVGWTWLVALAVVGRRRATARR